MLKEMWSLKPWLQYVPGRTYGSAMLLLLFQCKYCHVENQDIIACFIINKLQQSNSYLLCVFNVGYLWRKGVWVRLKPVVGLNVAFYLLAFVERDIFE